MTMEPGAIVFFGILALIFLGYVTRHWSVVARAAALSLIVNAALFGPWIYGLWVPTGKPPWFTLTLALIGFGAGVAAGTRSLRP